MGYILPDTFLEISIDSYKEYKVKLTDLELLKSAGSFTHENVFYYNKEDEITDVQFMLQKLSVKTIIFLSCYLESYFFDLGARTLGQSYTEQYLEKLDTISKIVVITKLITGKDLSREKHYWSQIKELIKWRNKIIHYKTKDATNVLKGIELADSRQIYEMFNLEEIFKSIEKLIENLSEIDPEGAHRFTFK